MAGSRGQNLRFVAGKRCVVSPHLPNFRIGLFFSGKLGWGERASQIGVMNSVSIIQKKSRNPSDVKVGQQQCGLHTENLSLFNGSNLDLMTVRGVIQPNSRTIVVSVGMSLGSASQPINVHCIVDWNLGCLFLTHETIQALGITQEMLVFGTSVNIGRHTVPIKPSPFATHNILGSGVFEATEAKCFVNYATGDVVINFL